MAGLFLLVVSIIAAIPLLILGALIVFAGGCDGSHAAVRDLHVRAARNFFWSKIFVWGSIVVGLCMGVHGALF